MLPTALIVPQYLNGRSGFDYLNEIAQEGFCLMETGNT
jgi:hypothetical protein